jgi:hypothetical protein
LWEGAEFPIDSSSEKHNAIDGPRELDEIYFSSYQRCCQQVFSTWREG